MSYGFDTVDDRLKSCSSWTRQAFRLFETNCLEVEKNVRWRDSSGSLGRLFYVEQGRGAFCRLDPKKEYVGIGFCKTIRDRVASFGILREGRTDMAWAFVNRDDDFEPITKLIYLAAQATISQRRPASNLPIARSPRALRTNGALETLEDYGFKHLTTLQWSGVGTNFRFDDPVNRSKTSRNFVYVWVDRARHRILNVGHTGQSFDRRFGDYIKWLNGKRKNDCDTPIRHDWLACLRGCRPGQVEVWIKPSAVDRASREAEEREWISRLNPILNRRK